jgi:predicted permease
MPTWLRRLRARLKYRRFDADLAHEIAAHREMKEAGLRSQGMTASDARTAAARQLGNITLAREDSRATWIPVFAQQLQQDARYALRAMRRQPGFTTASVAMLTIGLGLVAGGYTVVNGLFFRGWAVPANAEVIRVGASRQQASGDGRIVDGFSRSAYAYVRDRAQVADYVAYRIEYFRIRLSPGDRGAHTPGMVVSDNFIDVLRIPLQRGSGVASRAGDSGARVVISDRLWRGLFTGDPEIVGRRVWVQGVPATVVGVTARGFDGLAQHALDVIADFSLSRERITSGQTPQDHERACCVFLAGRLRAGRGADEAREELRLLTSQYRQSIGQPALAVDVSSTVLTGSADGMKNQSLLAMVLSLTGSGIVLVMLLTCANVGNLYLARSLRREREIAIRLSLGASRARVVRQMLTEGLVLASIAGLGAFGMTAGVPMILRLLEDDVTATMFASDWRVALFTGLGVIVTCLIVSLAPALQTTRIAWRGATATMTARAGPMRGLILATQIAIATVLVLSAALIARGIGRATSAPADYALHETTIVTIEPPAGLGSDQQRYRAVRAALIQTLRQSAPEVGYANARPGGRLGAGQSYVRRAQSEGEFRTQLIPMSSSSLAVLNIGLAAGRPASDDPAAAEAMVNETLARQLWPRDNPLGKALVVDFDDRIYTVTAVVRDSHLTSFSEVEPLVHIPLTSSLGLPVLLARTDAAVEEKLKTLVPVVDPQLTLTFTPMSAAMRYTLENAMVGAGIAGSLAVIALGLAIIGVFGVFSYLIEERRKEIGVRVALGATKLRVGRALMRATRVAIGSGLIVGVLLSTLAGIALRSFLFGLSPVDPVSYAAGALVIGGAAIVATAIPVRRALRVDPAITLRAE